eukprot:Gb_23034 [translate_table: standard]
MSIEHPCYTALRNAGMHGFFLLPNSFLDTSIIAEVIKCVTLHPKTFPITDEALHAVIGLLYDAPEVPEGPKKNEEEVVKAFCGQPNDFSTSGIKVKGLRDDNLRCITKLMAAKLFGFQRYTYFPTHMIPTISGVAARQRFNWCRYMRARLQTNLTKLPVPPGIPLKLKAWPQVYGQEIVADDHATVMVTQLQLADIEYQQFTKNYKHQILEGLETTITKLGAWILKCDSDQKEIFEFKTKLAKATRVTRKVMKEVDVANHQVATLGQDLQFTEWKVKKLEEFLQKNKIKIPKFTCEM